MTREELRVRILACIDNPGIAASAVDELLRDLAAWQRDHVEPFGRLWRAGGTAQPRDAAEIPALPTDVFRFARVAAHPPEEDLRVFRTSGTTQAARGVHAFRDLGLYDAAARQLAKTYLFPDVDRIHLVLLAPHEREAPGSSLSYMLSRFLEWFGDASSQPAWRGNALDLSVLVEHCEQAEAAGSPIALLGTSLAFAHADKELGPSRFSLARGSRVMQTGGFKGRAGEIEPSDLLQRIWARFDVRPDHVVSEYGMTELSSQFYEDAIRSAWQGSASPRRRFAAPPWMRVAAVDAELLRAVPDGQEGVLRICDCANLDSACCIQTADVARVRDGTFELVGRAPGSPLRGCSLAVDEALRGPT